MARVILDIPSDKIHSFLQAVIKLGIKDNAIRSKINETPSLKKSFLPVQHITKFLLFDWEFFSNELEYE
jgi:hypothetical protein